MLNSLAMQGARVVAGRSDNLHVSGHAYQVGWHLAVTCGCVHS
jgi:mRNA degradation ribonuclease J1/J2